MKYTPAQSSYFQQAVSLPMDALCLRDFIACANEVSASKQTSLSLRSVGEAEKILNFKNSVCPVSVGRAEFFYAYNSFFVNSVCPAYAGCAEFFLCPQTPMW